MNRTFIAALITVFLLAFAGSSSASSGAAGLSPSAVVVTPVSPSAWSFGIQFMPGVAVSKLEWELDLTYGVDDMGSVYEHYDWELRRMGFNRTDYKGKDNKVEAEYSWDGLKATLEVKRSGRRTDVELELKGRASSALGGAFRFERFGGINLPFYNAEITKLKWEVEFLHATTDHDSVFRYYDGGLVQQGWLVKDRDFDDDEIEAEYRNGDLKLELEVEREDGQVEVEFKLKK